MNTNYQLLFSEQDTQPFLDRWRGGKAMIWEYTVSHKVLTIRIEKKDQRGNLHIVCGDVLFIKGPTKWENASFEIERIEIDGVYLLILLDKNVGVEIQAGILGVGENCKPVY